MRVIHPTRKRNKNVLNLTFPRAHKHKCIVINRGDLSKTNERRVKHYSAINEIDRFTANAAIINGIRRTILIFKKIKYIYKRILFFKNLTIIKFNNSNQTERVNIIEKIFYRNE